MNTLPIANANTNTGEIINGFVSDIDSEKYMELVDQLEYAITVIGNEKDNIPITHSFTPGLYMRTMNAPAGCVVTGGIHKTQHPFVMTKGRMLLFSVGTGWVDIVAPYSGITQPGTRRVAIILEDTEWTTYHPTELTDLDQLWDHLILKRDAHINAALEYKAQLKQLEQSTTHSEGAD